MTLMFNYKLMFLGKAEYSLEMVKISFCILDFSQMLVMRFQVFTEMNHLLLFFLLFLFVIFAVLQTVETCWFLDHSAKLSSMSFYE